MTTNYIFQLHIHGLGYLKELETELVHKSRGHDSKMNHLLLLVEAEVKSLTVKSLGEW